ncbi:ankyrin repeat domain-containing protein [Prosthecobacter sp. SYSU 5D2]|uniref:ankyrin repeat domain-containing protein n=1 Tax=Prosthecobacter sp. SYSU 5D2 TaxID=3134134 RepID=UPI0031FF432F
MKRVFIGVFILMAGALIGQDGKASSPDKERLDQLYDAVQVGDVEVATQLLRSGVDPNGGTDTYPDIPFHKAISQGNKEMVTAFIEAGARLNGPFESNQTPLSSVGGLLPFVGDAENLLEFLISKGADPRQDPHALAAAAKRDLDQVRFLLDRGAPLTAEALGAAVQAYKMDVFEFLLQKGADSKAVLQDGDTLFYCACASSYHSFSHDTESPKVVTAMLDRLLALGVNPESANKKGRTPVHGAVESVNKEALKWLIQHGANLDATDHQGQTALMLAAHHFLELPEVVSILASGGASLDLLDRQNRSALDHAYETSRWLVVEKLVSLGASYGDAEAFIRRLVKTTETETIQTSSLRRMVTKVLPAIQDAKSFEVDGRSLMVWAVLVNDLELLKAFLAAGCPVDASDSDGRTPLLWAGMVGAKDIYAHLLLLGADPASTDIEGRTTEQWLAISSKRFSKPLIE